MNYLCGNKRSKIIHHFSSIAWFSLCKFCQQNENSEYMKIIQNTVACVLKEVGNLFLYKLHIAVCRGSSSDTTANKINPYYLII